MAVQGLIIARHEHDASTTMEVEHEVMVYASGSGKISVDRAPVRVSCAVWSLMGIMPLWGTLLEVAVANFD